MTTCDYGAPAPLAEMLPGAKRPAARKSILWAGAGMVGVLMAVVTATPAMAASWSVVSTPNTAAPMNSFAGAKAFGASDAWAVGWSQADWGTPPTALAARWNGTAWSMASTPTLSGSSALHGVDGSAAADVWAVGGVGTNPLTERWNGSSWSVVASPIPAGATGATLRGVKSLAANNVWAVGEYQTTTNPGRRTFILRWNGTAWSHTPSPNPDGVQNLLVAVDGVAANDVWALGNMGHDGYGGDTVAGLMLRWNGSAWSQVALPNGSGWETGFSTRKLDDIVAVASNDVWAVGTAFSFATFSRVPYYVHWNGTTWQEGTIPGPGTGDFTHGDGAVGHEGLRVRERERPDVDRAVERQRLEPGDRAGHVGGESGWRRGHRDGHRLGGRLAARRWVGAADHRHPDHQRLGSTWEAGAPGSAGCSRPRRAIEEQSGATSYQPVRPAPYG